MTTSLFLRCVREEEEGVKQELSQSWKGIYCLKQTEESRHEPSQYIVETAATPKTSSVKGRGHEAHRALHRPVHLYL